MNLSSVADPLPEKWGGGGRGTLLTVISSVRAPLSLAHLGAVNIS